MMVWYPIVGYGIFWIGLITAMILYAMYKKWYPIMYLISISTYIFTVSFIIDVFELSENGILLILAVSTLIMLGLGYYLSNKFKK